jgi:hypothetical protein
MIKQIYASPELTVAERGDLQHFLAGAAGLRCLNQSEADTQVWLGRSQALVFKVFDIARLKQRWRARRKSLFPVYGPRYGWAEQLNAARFERVLPGLPVRAYLEKTNALFCSRQVVAYPYLRGYTTLQEILEGGHKPFDALDAVEPVVLRMAQEGVFHLDLNSRNVMLDANFDVRIVDFEYVAWEKRRPGAMYAYYLGYLWQKWIQASLPASGYDAWFERHLDQRQQLFTESRGMLLDSFDLGKTRDVPRTERYRMFS